MNLYHIYCCTEREEGKDCAGGQEGNYLFSDRVGQFQVPVQSKNEVLTVHVAHCKSTTCGSQWFLAYHDYLYQVRSEEEEVGYASDFTLNIKCRFSSSSGSGRSGDSVNQSLIQIPRYTYLLTCLLLAAAYICTTLRTVIGLVDWV